MATRAAPGGQAAAEAPAVPAPRRWHHLEPLDLGAYPGALPVESAHRFPKHVHHGEAALHPGDGTPFWALQPQDDQGKRPWRAYRAPTPEQPRAQRAPGAGGAGGAGGGDDDGDFSVAGSDVASERGAPGASSRRPPPPGAGAGDDSRWWGRAPATLPDGYVPPPRPPPAPVTLAEEDGRWYRMKPKLPGEDDPVVCARSPEELEKEAAEAARRDHRGRLIPPGAATKWPEQQDKWYTLDRHQRFRQQQAWEVAAEKGTYDEWNPCRPEECVKPEELPERWWQMPPIDDGSSTHGLPPWPEPVPPKPGMIPTNSRPYEDGSRWYLLPNGHVMAPQWRDA